MEIDLKRVEKITEGLEVFAIPVKIIGTIDISIKLEKPNFLREEFIRLRIEISELPGKQYMASLVPNPFTCLTELSTFHAILLWAGDDDFNVTSSDPYLALEELLHKVERTLRKLGLIP